MTALVLSLRRSPYLIFGSASVLLAVLGLVWGLSGWLTPAQVTFWWQSVTGCALLVAMMYQWVVFFQRLFRDSKHTRTHYLAHRWVGVLATLLFALHAVRLGHVWMTALAVLFVLVAITGLLNREIVRYPKQWMYLVWLGTHMALSAMMVPLVGVHIWVALAYQ